VVTLTQTGSSVTGTYAAYGYPLTDAQLAGTIFSGVASGNTLSFSFAANTPGTSTGAFTYDPISQSFTGSSGEFPLWCGVKSGPLPSGCGWSGAWSTVLAGNPTAVALEQTSDLVSGSYDGGSSGSGTLALAVSDFRANGFIVDAAAQYQLHASFVIDYRDQVISGNENEFGGWCGHRTGSDAGSPSTCAGGGDLFDGVFYTDVSTVVLFQPYQSTSVRGFSVFYGDPMAIEYAISSTVDYTVPEQILSFYDDYSGNNVTLQTQDGISLGGTWFASEGALPWCGVHVGADSLGNPVVGELPAGCGFSNTFNLWTAEASAIAAASEPIVQVRSEVAGPVAANQIITGTVVAPRTYSFLPVVATGTFADTSAPSTPLGTFSWYPTDAGPSFRGDRDGGAPWCGSAGTTEPSPCLQ
jgi:hypothetical protein